MNLKYKLSYQIRHKKLSNFVLYDRYGQIDIKAVILNFRSPNYASASESRPKTEFRCYTELFTRRSERRSKIEMLNTRLQLFF